MSTPTHQQQIENEFIHSLHINQRKIYHQLKVEATQPLLERVRELEEQLDFSESDKLVQFGMLRAARQIASDLQLERDQLRQSKELLGLNVKEFEKEIVRLKRSNDISENIRLGLIESQQANHATIKQLALERDAACIQLKELKEKYEKC